MREPRTAGVKVGRVAVAGGLDGDLLVRRGGHDGRGWTRVLVRKTHRLTTDAQIGLAPPLRPQVALDEALATRALVERVHLVFLSSHYGH